MDFNGDCDDGDDDDDNNDADEDNDNVLCFRSYMTAIRTLWLTSKQTSASGISSTGLYTSSIVGTLRTASNGNGSSIGRWCHATVSLPPARGRGRYRPTPDRARSSPSHLYSAVLGHEATLRLGIASAMSGCQMVGSARTADRPSLNVLPWRGVTIVGG